MEIDKLQAQVKEVCRDIIGMLKHDMDEMKRAEVLAMLLYATALQRKIRAHENRPTPVSNPH